MSSIPPTAGQLASRLIAREADRSGTGGVGPALSACALVFAELAQWLGEAGCRALVVRAVAEARSGHPAALAVVRLVPAGDLRFDGLDAAVQAHGSPAVAAALEAVLAAWLGLLGRLIGDDMAARLVEPHGSTHARHDESQT